MGVRLSTLLVVFLALAATCGWSFTIWQATADAYRRAEAEAHRRSLLRLEAARNLVSVMLQGVEALQNIAQLRHQYRDDPERRTILTEALLELSLTRPFGILQIGLIDTDGVSRWTSLSSASNIDLADREHFRVHIDADRGLFISAPLRGRVSNAWSIQFSRRLNNEDGSFGGVAVFSVDPFIIARMLESLPRGEDQRITLYRADGLLLARNGMTEAMLERGYRARHQPGPDGDRALKSVSGLTGDVRYRAVGWLPGQRLMVAVNSLADKELSSYQEVRSALLVALVFGVLMIIAAAGLALALRARAEAGVEASLAAHVSAEQKRMLDAMPAAVCIIRCEAGGARHVVLSNQPYQEMSVAVAGDVLVEYPLSACYPSVTSAAPMAGITTFERQVDLRDGSKRWTRWWVTPLEREVAGREFLVTVIDIEGEKAATAAAMTSSRLATLGELSASLAHELGQPLSVISLSAEICQLAAGNCPEGPRAILMERQSTIVEMVARARAITDHLRRFARNDVEELEQVDLKEVVDGARLLVAHALHESEITLEMRISDPMPRVWGVRILLEQVVMNLLLNARDAMVMTAMDQRAIIVEARAVGSWVEVEVTDNGPGIPPAILGRIFDPFFTTKAYGHGTGLGLSICHGILKSAGGSISAANQPQGGATFKIKLQSVAENPPLENADAAPGPVAA